MAPSAHRALFGHHTDRVYYQTLLPFCETLDTFGELVATEERIDRLLHVLPRRDWTPPQDAMVNLSITMERLNNLQARYRAALVDVQQWTRHEAQHIRDDVEMDG